MYKHFFKRFLDFILSLTALLIIWPVLLLVAAAVKLTSKGPVFFMQDRLGKHGKIFRIYKFRTMTHKQREVNREIRKGDPEVTAIGGVLRRFKIDELPQLLNVLKGDMSIVGPRPPMPKLLERMDDAAKVRLNASPGLTGLAQINGSIYLSWEDRWKYDKYYVEHISFLLDVKTVVKTVMILFRGEDKFVNKPEGDYK